MNADTVVKYARVFNTTCRKETAFLGNKYRAQNTTTWNEILEADLIKNDILVTRHQTIQKQTLLQTEEKTYNCPFTVAYRDLPEVLAIEWDKTNEGICNSK